jgi:hypothetical protein
MPRPPLDENQPGGSRTIQIRVPEVLRDAVHVMLKDGETLSDLVRDLLLKEINRRSSKLKKI